QIHEQEKLQLYIMDLGGNIVASSRQNTDEIRSTNKIMNMLIEDILAQPSSRWFNTNDKGAEDLIIKRHASDIQWLMTAVSDGTRLTQTLQNIDLYFLRLFLLGFFLSIVVAFMITGYIRRPIIQLINNLRQIEHGDLDVRVSLNRED